VAYVAGSDQAAETLCAELASRMRISARFFLGTDSAEIEDVVQESLVAILAYIRKGGGFEGDLVSFAVTVARNRCRNLLNWHARRPQVPIDGLAEWIADRDRSPLDTLLEAEVHQHLQAALDALGDDCRTLLRAFYLEGVSIESIRQRIGLATVQGVYYRRSVCLDQLREFLKARLDRGSIYRRGSA